MTGLLPVHKSPNKLYLRKHCKHLSNITGYQTLLAKTVAVFRMIKATSFVLDRSHGKEFCKQFEDSCIKIEDYVNTLEREILQRKAVLTMCENSEIFYDEQFKEAKIVANVSIVIYKNNTLMCLSIETPKNNKFSICSKWKIYYF